MAILSFSFRNKKFNMAFFSEDDHIYKSARKKKFYEVSLLEYIRRLGVRCDVAIDVGANVGNHSVYFGSFLADHVVSVEANNDVIPILKAKPGK